MLLEEYMHSNLGILSLALEYIQQQSKLLWCDQLDIQLI
jgi:hypothetical protein